MGTTHPHTVRIYPSTPDEILASCPRPGIEVRSSWSALGGGTKTGANIGVEYEVGPHSITVDAFSGDINFITIGFWGPKLDLMLFKVTKPGITSGTWNFTGLGRRSIDYVDFIACNTKGY